MPETLKEWLATLTEDQAEEIMEYFHDEFGDDEIQAFLLEKFPDLEEL